MYLHNFRLIANAGQIFFERDRFPKELDWTEFHDHTTVNNFFFL
jgi:hypothetical protein